MTWAQPCAVAGLGLVTRRRAAAIEAVRQGDAARATGDPGRARERYGYALTLDARNADAGKGLAATSSDRPVDRLGSLLEGSGPAILAVLLVLAVAARLATWLVKPAPPLTRLGAGPLRRQRFWEPAWVRWLLGALGFALLIASAVGWVSLVAADRANGGTVARQFVWCAVASVGGVLLLASATGHRLAVRVQVQDDKGAADAAAAGYVSARLATLGSDRPRGLRTPRGTDVTQLPSDAVSMLPTGAVLQTVVRTVQALLPTTPWQATVLLSGETATVELTRNGRAAGSVVISQSDVTGAGGGAKGSAGVAGDAGTSRTDNKPTAGQSARQELLTAAAAYLLLRLAAAHPRLQVGLCRAISWRGLACQVLAAEPPYVDNLAERTELNARAVNRDPTNAAAWLGYLHTRAAARQGDPRAHLRLASRLDALYARLPVDEFGLLSETGERGEVGWAALRMRILYSRAAAWFNLALLQKDQPDSHAYANARAATLDLAEYTKRVTGGGPKLRPRPSTELRDFAADMCRTAELLRVAVAPLPKRKVVAAPAPQPDLRYSLQDLYDAAANSAEQIHANGDDRLRRAALDYLDLALGLRSFREQAVNDPSFESLSRNDDFLDLVGCGGTQLSGLRAVGAHAEKLANRGIRYPSQLVGWLRPSQQASTGKPDSPETDAARRKTLASALGVPEETVDWWVGLCDLAEDCPEGARSLALAWVNLLSEQGVNTIDDLRNEMPAALYARLLRAAEEEGVPRLSMDELRQWADRG